MICKICGKELNNKGISSHLRRNHFISNKEYYDKYLLKENEGKCHICGKDTVFDTILTGYRRYCSTKCANLDPFIRQKIEHTSLEKYGVKCNLNLPEIKIKAINNSQSENAIKKRKQTNLDKYNVENVFAAEEIKNKIKQNNLNSYNVEYNWQREDVKQKIINTNMKIYGTKYAQQSETIKNLVKNNRNIAISNFCLENDCISRQELIDKFGTGWTYCINELNIDYLFFNNIAFIKISDIPKIEEYYKISHTYSSHKEKDLVNFIKTFYNNTLIENSRNIIHPMELDIYLPILNLAIEYNGNYWHSFERNNDINYHLRKSLKCRDKNIRLIHIYEFEDFEKQKQLLKDLIQGIDNYPKNDFNKNNLIENIPESEIIYKENNFTIYGAGKLEVI